MATTKFYRKHVAAGKVAKMLYEEGFRSGQKTSLDFWSAAQPMGLELIVRNDLYGRSYHQGFAWTASLTRRASTHPYPEPVKLFSYERLSLCAEKGITVLAQDRLEGAVVYQICAKGCEPEVIYEMERVWVRQAQDKLFYQKKEVVDDTCQY